MTKTIRRAAVSALAASALVLAGGTAALAGEEASFHKCKHASFASAGPDGADAGSKLHCVGAHAISD